MKLSIIIPVYNEKDTILELLQRVEAVDFGIEAEIIIVDDGSTDGTTEILVRTVPERDPASFKVIFCPRNQGKGAALRRGFGEARGEIIAVQDADLEYRPQDLPKLVRPILEGRAEVVYGSRFLRPMRHRYRLFYLGNKLYSFLFWSLYGAKISDPATCYKVFKKEILDKFSFQRHGFDFEAEFTSKILKAGYKILELPISYAGRSFTEGKKINACDGLKIARTIIKERFYGSDP